MSRGRRPIPRLMAVGVLLAASAAVAGAAPIIANEVHRRPADDPRLPGEAVERAIDRGVAFLVRTQNENGSWGSPAPTLFLDIYSPAPGSQQAYQVASSALALSALLEVGGDTAAVKAAVAKGADWLVAHHAVRRPVPRAIYNNWAHAYALEAFARLLQRETDPERQAVYRDAGRLAIERLETYRYVDGGWGYYDFSVGSKTPSHGQANSFTTATVLVALRMARDAGIDVPKRLIGPAKQLLRACRLPGGSFKYSYRADFNPPRGISAVEGSLARTPACLDALLDWDEPVPTSNVVDAFENLETYGHFLLIARKYPRPHESWFQNSGYFAFYGYYYASDLLPRLPAEKRRFHAGRIADHLVPLQEEDGSWWDYQLFGFHKYYGSGYVLMTLGRCLDAMAEEDGA